MSKLEDLKKARKAKEAALEAAAAEAKDARDIADAEALLAQDGRQDIDFATVLTDFGLLILKRPDGPVFRAFQDKGKYNSETLEALVHSCRVYPSAAQLTQILDTLPALLPICSSVITGLAGAKQVEDSEK